METAHLHAATGQGQGKPGQQPHQQPHPTICPPTCASSGRVSVPSPTTRCASRVGGPFSHTLMPPCMCPQFSDLVGAPPPVAITQFLKGASSCAERGAGGRQKQQL
jgi:hypothetical protein